MNDDDSLPDIGDIFWPAVVCIVAVALLVDLGVTKNWNGDRSFSDPLLFGLIAVAGMWLGMGNTRLLARLGCVFTATICTSATVAGQSNVAHEFHAQMSLLNLIAGLAALATFALRLTGWRVVGRRPPAALDAAGELAPQQFSLRQLFTWTTAAAMVAAVLKYSDADPRNVLPMLLPISLLLGLSLLAAWAMLTNSRTAWLIALLTLPAATAALALLSTGGWQYAAGAAIELVAVLLALLPFRMLGFRATFRAAGGDGMSSLTPATDFSANQFQLPNTHDDRINRR